MPHVFHAHKLTGVILAGGQARRMQPGAPYLLDKGLLPVDGQPLVAHSAAFLRPQVKKLLISTNRNAPRYAVYGRVVADDRRFGIAQGPLVGLLSVMMQVDTPWLMVLPVDVAALPHDLVRRLSAALQNHTARLAWATTAQAHPLCLLLAASLRPALERYLQQGGRRVMPWVQAQGGIAIPFAPDTLHNLNTAQDWMVSQCLAPPVLTL